MTSRDFAFWLQGVFEVADLKTLDEKQTLLIKQHLNLVFKHEIDPSMGDQKHQDELNTIHNTSKTNYESFEDSIKNDGNELMRC
jgi:hypothetical protein